MFYRSIIFSTLLLFSTLPMQGMEIPKNPELERAVYNLNASKVARLINNQGRRFSDEEANYYINVLSYYDDYSQYREGLFWTSYISVLIATLSGSMVIPIWRCEDIWKKEDKNDSDWLKIKRPVLKTLYYAALPFFCLSTMTLTSSVLFSQFSEYRGNKLQAVLDVVNNNRIGR